jgi:hypothetical protein
MEVVVELSTGTVVLADVDQLQGFAVRALPQHPGDGPADGALGALAAALSVHDVGTVQPDGDVLIPVDVVRRLAASAVAEQGRTLDKHWETGFAAMIEYAGTKGWLAEDGSLRAHVEWGS